MCVSVYTLLCECVSVCVHMYFHACVGKLSAGASVCVCL